MTRTRGWLVALALITAVDLAVARQFSDVRALVDFQRAADDYAFLHRRIERKVGTAPTGLANAIQAQRPGVAGSLFTPAAADAMRDVLARAARDGCDPGVLASAPEPAVYESAATSRVLPACAVSALPRLPEELEYRASGNAIVLVDTHAGMIIDVLGEPLARGHTRR